MRRFFLYICVALALCLALFPRFTSAPDRQLQAAVIDDLHNIHIVPHRVRVLGYEREKFGSGWGNVIDEATGTSCTTRHKVLSEAFHTDDCGAGDGRTTKGVEMKDPYTGKQITAAQVDIDHIVPLAAAWDMGAWRWDYQQRHAFANDIQLNLVAVESAVNRDKSDATLAEWMPPDASTRCAYAARFLRVVATYQLELAQADAQTARKACRV